MYMSFHQQISSHCYYFFYQINSIHTPIQKILFLANQSSIRQRTSSPSIHPKNSFIPTMRGINIQFDNLTQHLENTMKNQEISLNRQAYELTFEKVTQQTLKLVSIIFEELIHDYTILDAKQKLFKAIKTFIKNKPSSDQDDEDDYFNTQFDEVKQFMNNRDRPVEVDNEGRGDIYKFLSQVESKEKDLSDLMSGINRLPAQDRKLFTMSSKKGRDKTQKTIKVISERQDAQVQTELDMECIGNLEKQNPFIFKIERKIVYDDIGDVDLDFLKNKSGTGTETGANLSKNQSTEEKSKDSTIQGDKNKKQTVKNQEKNKQVGKGLDKGGAKGQKKKNNHNNASSSGANKMKRDSKSSAYKLESGAANNQKSAFTKGDNKMKKNHNRLSEEQSSSVCQQNDEAFKKQTIQTLTQMKLQQQLSEMSLGDLKSIFPTLSEDQLIQMHKSLQKDDTLKEGAQNGCCCVSEMTQTQPNSFNQSKQKDAFALENSTMSTHGSGSNGKNVRFHSMNEDEVTANRSRGPSVKEKDSAEYRLLKESDIVNQTEFLRNGEGLPHEGQLIDPSVSPSSKMLRSTLQDRKVTTKQKQNYTLDMYRTKKQQNGNHKSSKLPSSSEYQNQNQNQNQNSSLPSIHRNGNTMHNSPKNSSHNKGSLLESLNSANVRKQHYQLMKTGEDFRPMGSNLRKSKYQNGFDQQNNNKESNKQNKSSHMVSKEEERIMKELQRMISGDDGSIKKNSKNIHLYIQFVETIHRRNCGEKCIHLERFYKFLMSKNIPLRKELCLAKTDMNKIVPM